ncbi:aspartate aminotransferase family protein [Sneathiella chungangensis]|uniref:Aspartate aminotransferase family protein n=1 Tax=Sneathiella chungangensis TaxID=1418234 RepID=A0A845MCP5_9PROT|nr:aspartate aminotransferase family protein [Sneathiella chungangensis]MZR21748.1 aspartate aminotransferase family protein [Sneathiella chungangensis]
MTHVFHRNPRAEQPVVARGDGPYIYDKAGKQYLDASGGAAVSCLGHSNKFVADAMKEQIDKISFAHSGFFTNQPMEDLADFLVARAPGNLDHVYFVSGGSEAVEAALKLARQYFLEKGENSRTRFISRRQSYHGNTIGALAAGGNQWRREPYAPLLMPVPLISPCYEYREKRNDETSGEFGQRVAGELETALIDAGPENVCAFICEPVVGATMGAVPAVEGYFKRIREICDQYGILFIADEVMCGMGRTGSLFAVEQEGVAPDILVTAKGLGAGYQAIGAMLVSNEILRTIVDGSGFFQHGHTYMGHPVSCAAALAVQNYIEDNDLLSNVRRRGEQLHDALTARLGNNPFVGDIRGRGLFRGIELVADRMTREPLDPSLKIHAKIKSAAMEAGLMCYPMGGTIDGRRGDHILLAPPFIIDETHIAEIVEKLGSTVENVLAKAIQN